MLIVMLLQQSYIKNHVLSQDRRLNSICAETATASGVVCSCTGFPSVGKSTILTQLTGTQSEVAAYEFTTLTCIPGVIHYNDAKIQLLDLPGIIEGAAQGKGAMFTPLLWLPASGSGAHM